MQPRLRAFIDQLLNDANKPGDDTKTEGTPVNEVIPAKYHNLAAVNLVLIWPCRCWAAPPPSNRRPSCVRTDHAVDRQRRRPPLWPPSLTFKKVKPYSRT